jgi:hypothetical protein
MPLPPPRSSSPWGPSPHLSHCSQKEQDPSQKSAPRTRHLKLPPWSWGDISKGRIFHLQDFNSGFQQAADPTQGGWCLPHTLADSNVRGKPAALEARSPGQVCGSATVHQAVCPLSWMLLFCFCLFCAACQVFRHARQAHCHWAPPLAGSLWCHYLTEGRPLGLSHNKEEKPRPGHQEVAEHCGLECECLQSLRSWTLERYRTPLSLSFSSIKLGPIYHLPQRQLYRWPIEQCQPWANPRYHHLLIVFL